MKAPATRTAKPGKPAASGAKPRAAAGVAAKARATATAKPVAKAAVKKKAPAKAPVAAKKAPMKAVPAKPAVKSAAKPVAKTANKGPATKRPAVKAAPVAAKKVATAPASAAKKAAAPAKTPAAKPAVAPARKASSSTAQAAKPMPPPRAAQAAAVVPRPPAPVVVPAAPKPLGKRAAKKIMLEQMSQAEVVPTHDPNAAKATYSHMKNERAVMSPPAPSTVQKDPKRANNWKTLPVEQLTDQDVQAMPDSEYMNDLQLAFFRRKLVQLKADMLANAGETTEHLREDTVVVPDPADRATIEEEHALELRTRDRERKLLKKIEQAIARIDAGDYGYCEETGEPIGVGRLMARPTASLSLEAQQRRELKQKMFGD